MPFNLLLDHHITALEGFQKVAIAANEQCLADALADTINQLKEIQGQQTLSMKVTKLIAAVRIPLQAMVKANLQIQSNAIALADAAYHTLLRLAELSPIRDPKQTASDPSREVIISTGHVINIDGLMQHHQRRPGLSSLGEATSGLNSYRFLINPTTLERLSLRDAYLIKEKNAGQLGKGSEVNIFYRYQSSYLSSLLWIEAFFNKALEMTTNAQDAARILHRFLELDGQEITLLGNKHVQKLLDSQVVDIDQLCPSTRRVSLTLFASQSPVRRLADHQRNILMNENLYNFFVAQGKNIADILSGVVTTSAYTNMKYCAISELVTENILSYERAATLTLAECEALCDAQRNQVFRACYLRTGIVELALQQAMAEVLDLSILIPEVTYIPSTAGCFGRTQ